MGEIGDYSHVLEGRREGGVTSVVSGMDGNTLFSGNGDSAIEVWGVR